jgi:hypothetical protein
MKCGTVVAGIVGLLLAGCSADVDSSMDLTNQPGISSELRAAESPNVEDEAPRPKPANVRYESIFDIREALEKGGIACDRWRVIENPGPPALERANCTSWMVFGVYRSATDAQRDLSVLVRQIQSLGLDVGPFVLGPNWLVNCSGYPERCQVVRDFLGGDVVVP